MSKLITSRWVRLVLAVAAVAAIVVAVLRLRRSPAGQNPATSETASGGETGEAGNAPEPSWPPVPILGVPTDDDLVRYATGPSALERFFGDLPSRAPRAPLEEVARGRLIRWGVVGLGLCLLVLGTQVLENAVFSKDLETVEETTAFVGTAGGEPDGRESDSCPEEAYGVTPGGEVGVATTAVGCVFNDVFPWTGSDGEASGDVSLEILNGAGAADGDRAEEEPVPVREPVTDADCRPEVREPRARAVSPTVTRAVNRQWRRIETWLKTNAPKTRLTLGEPAKARTIAVAEAQMGLRFPDDLRASLLRHNGAVFARDTRAFGFLGHENQDVRAIRDHWRGLCEIDGGEEGDPRSEWWDGRMIPFGADGSGDHLVIDSAVRDVGETDHEGQLGFTPGEIRIGSYYALLKATANALETGGSVGYWKPEAVDGELEWNIPDKS